MWAPTSNFKLELPPFSSIDSWRWIHGDVGSLRVLIGLDSGTKPAAAYSFNT